MILDKDKTLNLDQYLELLHDIDIVQSSGRALELCFYEAYVDAYVNGTDFLEMRFNPAKRGNNNQLDLDTLIISTRRGKEKVCDHFGIDGTLALCLGRDTLDANMAIAQKAFKYKGSGVSTIDIAGSEKLPLQLESFVDIYREAKDRKLPLTVHIGETDDSTKEDIEFAINRLKVDRIGHGTRINERSN